MVSPFSFLKEYRHPLAAALFLFAAVFLMLSLRGSPDVGLGPLRGVVLQVVGSIQRVVLSPVQALRAAQERYQSLAHLDRENRELKADLERMEPRLTRLTELEYENRRLRDLLAMPPRPDYRMVSSRVVGDSSSAFSQSFLIDVGSAHGVPDMAPVMGHQGLIGRVVKAGESTSQVLSLLDINSRVPVLVQRSRVRGILAGTNSNRLTLEFIAKDANIRVGDHVITSGLGGVFAKGLLVGWVVATSHQGLGLFQHVEINPQVDFSRIEEVRVLIPERRLTE